MAAEGQVHRPISLSSNGGQRFAQCVGRSFLRRCPYCGGGGIFKGWFSLKERCPHCDVLYEPEDGYLLGSYVVNIGITAVAAVAIVVWLMIASDLSVLQIQIIGAGLAVGLPVFLYPYTQLFWISLDLLFHPTKDYSDTRKR
jgi:uncharacterized protein (DUF983 family)